MSAPVAVRWCTQSNGNYAGERYSGCQDEKAAITFAETLTAVPEDEQPMWVTVTREPDGPLVWSWGTGRYLGDSLTVLARTVHEALGLLLPVLASAHGITDGDAPSIVGQTCEIQSAAHQVGELLAKAALRARAIENTARFFGTRTELENR